jgi:hypothetical protein
MKGHITLPPIIVGTQDYYRLIGAARTGRQRGNPCAEALMTELQRAVIVHPDDLPLGVVSTNSHVTYRLDDNPEAHTRVLVHAGEVARPGVELPVRRSEPHCSGCALATACPSAPVMGSNTKFSLSMSLPLPARRCPPRNPHNPHAGSRQRPNSRSDAAAGELQREPGPEDSALPWRRPSPPATRSRSLSPVESPPSSRVPDKARDPRREGATGTGAVTTQLSSRQTKSETKYVT